MPAAQFDMNLDRGSTFKIILDLENTANEPVDLSNYSAEMQVRRSINDDKMVCRLTDAWPQGSVGPGVAGEFIKGSGVTGHTGGIVLNYQGVTGKILIEIDNKTSYWGFQKPRSFYDLKLTNNGDNSVTSIIKGEIRSSQTLINTERLPASFAETPTPSATGTTAGFELSINAIVIGSPVPVSSYYWIQNDSVVGESTQQSYTPTLAGPLTGHITVTNSEGFSGATVDFGTIRSSEYNPFVVDRRPIYGVDFAVGNLGTADWRMTSIETQITNPTANPGGTEEPQDAVRTAVEVTMQREYERGFRRFAIRTPMGARTSVPTGSALPSASWSAGDPNLGTWNDLQNIATVKSGGATLEYVFTTTGRRMSVDETAATADRQQSFINFMKPWIDSKAAAGDPVQVYIYDGYQLAFHDTAQTDPAKGNLAMKGSWESGWNGDTRNRFPLPDFSKSSHVEFRENEVIPWRDQVGIKGFMVDAASNAGDTLGNQGIARAPGYFEFYRDRGLDIMGEAVPVIQGAGGTYDLNPDLYKLTPYVGYGGGTADGTDGNFWGNRNWRTIFPATADSEIHMTVQWAWQGATGGINSEYWNGATYDWAGITAELKQAHDNGFVIDAGFGPYLSPSPAEEAKRYIVLDYIVELGGNT